MGTSNNASAAFTIYAEVVRILMATALAVKPFSTSF
jgi:hypothetical protein